MAGPESKGKKLMKTILWAVLILVCHPVAADAVDIATEHTQIMNYMELITENLRQLQSLENQIMMIKNQVEELKSVASYQDNFMQVDALRNNLAGITNQGTALSDQTQSILNQMQQALTVLPPGGSMIDGHESLDQDTLNAVQNTLRRVAQIRAAYQQAVDSLNELMDKNDRAVGQTQALQTSNEIAAQNIVQMQSTQELLSEQISLQGVAMAKRLQEEKQEDEDLKQIFNDAVGSGNPSGMDNP